MKRCTKCGLEKDESEFSNDVSRQDGLCRVCKACMAVNLREWRKANPEKSRQMTKKYQQENHEKVLRWQHNHAFKKRTEVLARVRGMLSSAKSRCKRSGVLFNLSATDVPQPFPSLCPVLHTPMVIGSKGFDSTTASLDRINNNMGYVPGNVAVISRRANAIKGDATIEELELVLAYMKRHAAQQEQQEQGPEPCNT